LKKRLPRPLVWMLRLLLIGVAGLILLFFGSNLFLASKPGQRLVQKQLARRAPALLWSHEEVSWTPWNGIVIKNLKARLKDHPKAPPLLNLKEGTLQPYWAEIFRGKRVLREISLSEPIINLPLEAILLTQPARPVPTPEAKETDPEPPKAAKPTEPQRKKTETPRKPQQPQPESGPEKIKKSPQKTQPKPTSARSVPPPDPRLWLRMKNARVRLYSLSNNISFVVDGLNAELPLAGEATEGSLRWDKISLNDAEIVAATNVPIIWEKPSWTLPRQTLALGGSHSSSEDSISNFELQLAGQFGIRAKGLPFRFQSYFPPQTLPETLLHKTSGLTASFEQATWNLSAAGRLADPMSWRFDSLAAAQNLSLFSNRRGEHFTFETASSQVILRQGIIAAPSLSLRSERLSLMANGQLHLGGYLLGVLRIVAAPDLEERLTSLAIGSLISQGWTRHWLRPLETPDRYYRDLHFEGRLPDPLVNAGRKGEFLHWTQLQELLKQFYQREISEEPTLTP
jgi:hypothetical protein